MNCWNSVTTSLERCAASQWIADGGLLPVLPDILAHVQWLSQRLTRNGIRAERRRNAWNQPLHSLRPLRWFIDVGFVSAPQRFSGGGRPGFGTAGAHRPLVAGSGVA
jgi:hypothetical protein